MKVKIKSTGEIVNVNDYTKIILNIYSDPVELGLKEVEFIQDTVEDDHWQDVRERAAIAAMQSLIREFYDKRDNYLFAENIGAYSVKYANALVDSLKNNEK